MEKHKLSAAATGSTTSASKAGQKVGKSSGKEISDEGGKYPEGNESPPEEFLGEDEGNFLTQSEPNGAYIDRSRGAKLGLPMQKIIATEPISDPYAETEGKDPIPTAKE
jgi:hypothetical protein